MPVRVLMKIYLWLSIYYSQLCIQLIYLTYLTNWSKIIILLPCFQKFSYFRKVYLKTEFWVVKLNIEKSWFDYQDARCWNLAIQYELPNLLPGPNLQFRFMKNSVHTSLLGSLPPTHTKKATHKKLNHLLNTAYQGS